MHRALETEARKKKLTGERFRAYVFGTLARYKKEHEKSNGKGNQKQG